MGLLDDLGGLKGMLGQISGAATPALISAVLAKTDLGGLQGIVAKLQQGGLSDQVQSWLSSGSNLPISADQLRSVLGNQQVQQIAGHFGISTDDALKLLSQHLPNAVDQASPDGALQPDSNP